MNYNLLAPLLPDAAALLVASSPRFPPPGLGERLLLHVPSGFLREELRDQRHEVRRRAVL